jgi:hypothetical protein
MNRVVLYFAAEVKRTLVVASPESIVPYLQRDGIRVAIVEKGILETIAVAREMAILSLVIDVDVVSRYRTAHRNLFGLGMVEDSRELLA